MQQSYSNHLSQPGYQIVQYSALYHDKLIQLYTDGTQDTLLLQGFSLFKFTLNTHGYVKVIVTLFVTYLFLYEIFSVGIWLTVPQQEQRRFKLITHTFLLCAFPIILILFYTYFYTIRQKNISNKYLKIVLNADFADIDNYYFSQPPLQSGKNLWICLNGQELIGCCAIDIMKEETLKYIKQLVELKESPRVAELIRVRVAAKYRKKGVGSQLTKMAIDFAQKVGYDYIYLDAASTNPAALKLYEKFGFQLLKVEYKFFGLLGKLVGQNLLLFLKHLSKKE